MSLASKGLSIASSRVSSSPHHLNQTLLNRPDPAYNQTSALLRPDPVGKSLAKQNGLNNIKLSKVIKLFVKIKMFNS